jgi:O-antigen/teichoic acid export membrane protein
MLREAFWVLGTRLTNRASNFLIFLLLARALSVGEFGLYGYIVSTALVLSVACDLGLRQSGAFFIGHQPEARAAVATHLVLAWLLLGSLAGTLGWLGLAWGGHDAARAGTGPLVAGATAAMLLVRMGQGVFLGQGAIRSLNQSELVSRAVMLGGTLALWISGRLTLTTALWLLLLAHAAAGARLLVQIRGLLRPRLLLDRALLVSLVRHGALFAAGVVLMSLMGRVGIWVVNARLDPDALGAFFGVLRLAEMIVEVATAVGIVIFSHGVRTADTAAATAEAVRVCRAVLLVMALAAACLGVLAAPFLGLALGPSYAAEAPAFRILLLGAVPSCLTMMLFPSLTSQGHARYGVPVFGPGVLANLALTWLLAPVAGVAGAATGTALANLLVATILVLIYRRRLGVGIGPMLFLQAADLAAASARLRALRRKVLPARLD